jgi:plastocyanin
LKTRLKKSLLILMILTLAMPILSVSAAETHAGMETNAAADLRVALDQLLGEHAVLAVYAMQKGIDGSADFDQAAGALLENSADLAAAVGSVYGEDAGEAFKGLWDTHIGFFVDYVTATANNDEEGQQAALDALEGYGKDFGAFLAGANPNIDASTIETGLKGHVEQLIAAFDNYVAGDYTAAYENARAAYAHMFMTGDLLAGAIVKQFPETFNNSNPFTPAADLRVGVSQLLGEHAMAAVFTMQKGIDGSADFGAAANVLGQNTSELSAAIGSVYGEDAGEAFKGLWESHIGFFVNYVVATAENNEDGRQAARAELDGYGKDFGAFLAGANPNIDASTIEAGLKAHVEQLIGAFDNYVVGDYTAAYENVRSAYAHMFMTGKLLSGAIVKQFPEAFEEDTTQPEPTPEPEPAPTKMMKLWLKIGSDELKVNGEVTQLDVAPFIESGRTYVSLRALSETIGAYVSWDSATREVKVEAGNDTAIFWVDNNVMTLNGVEKRVDDTVFIKNGRTQVPLRFIAELFSWNVLWNSDDSSIQLTKKTAAATENNNDQSNMDEEAATVTVEIKGFTFQPGDITIKKGTKVTFTNMDDIDHTATADDGSFDTGILLLGESSTITFNEVGEFSYFCTVHPSMKAKITVIE